MRFVEAWLAALEAAGDRTVLSGSRRTYTGVEAADTTRRWGAAFVAHRLRAGDVVAFHGEPDEEWPLLQLAVMRAGGVVALIPRTDDAQTLCRLIGFTGARYVLSAEEHDAEMAAACIEARPHIVQVLIPRGKIRNPKIARLDLMLQSGDLLLQDAPHEFARREVERTADDLAAAVFSAGTMSLARSFRVSHSRLFDQVEAVSKALGKGPALYARGRMDLIDHMVLMWAALLAGRELVVAAEPPTDRPWEWVVTADELADRLFSRAWPVTGPGPLPRGPRRWLFGRDLTHRLRQAYPHLKGVHTGFSVPVSQLNEQLRRAKVRLTWGYGLAEAYGFCTWEEAGRGYGTVLPSAHLAMHSSALVFDWTNPATGWWQATGDWARTVGPWIHELEPHGAERGEVPALMAARRVEREIADHPFIAAAFVSGPEPLSNLALLTLRREVVLAWARENGLVDLAWEELLARDELREPILARARAIGHRAGMMLQPHILAGGFTEASGERTARGEFRRALVMRRATQYLDKPRPQE